MARKQTAFGGWSLTARPLAFAGAAIVLMLGLTVALFQPRPFWEPLPDAELRRQIGQMLMVGFRGTSIDQRGPRLLRGQIADGTVGGVLYLGRNVVSQDAVREMNRAFLDASGGPPPFIAVDQEGGRVQRLNSTIGFPETPSARWLGSNTDPESAMEHYARMAFALRSVGFNTNLGPVVDLDVEPTNPIIARLERSYSSDPVLVSSYARAFITAHRQAAIVTALKHFPGHGSTTLDSHRALPDISATWTASELEPYRSLFGDSLADMVMVGHLALARDGEDAGLPATLSHAVVTGLLRGELGFDGVIISDDLDMAAIADRYRDEEAAIAAIRAGIDIVIVSNYQRDDPLLPARLVAAIGREAMRDPQLRQSITDSNRRIEALKRERLGLEPIPET